MSITHTQFSIAPMGGEQYQLNIQFCEEENMASEKVFTFTKSKVSGDGGQLFDAYSINGLYSSKILKKLFKESDVEEVKSAVQKLEKMQANGPTIVVLDIKSQQGYQGESIAKAEKIICDFFNSGEVVQGVSPTAKKVHALFQKHKPVDFVICEGSLKTRLVEEFTPEQAAFLQSKPGSPFFCQIAEYFMNGFKFGHDVLDLKQEDYIVSLTGKTFIPCKKSTVLYPSLYQNLYAVEGDFAQSISPVFQVGGAFDPQSKITLVDVEVKA